MDLRYFAIDSSWVYLYHSWTWLEPGGAKCFEVATPPRSTKRAGSKSPLPSRQSWKSSTGRRPVRHQHTGRFRSNLPDAGVAGPSRSGCRKCRARIRPERSFSDRANYFGQLSEFDAQGRVLIPSRLRECRGDDGEVDVLGQVEYIDVWNHERFAAKLQREPFTDDDSQGARGVRDLSRPMRRFSLHEVVSMLAPRGGRLYVDCTVGLGGHTAALSSRRSRTRDWDRSRRRSSRISRGSDWPEIGTRRAGPCRLPRLDRRPRGSRRSRRSTASWPTLACRRAARRSRRVDSAFVMPGPLDMRMDQSQGRTLGEWLAAVDESRSCRRHLAVRRRAARPPRRAAPSCARATRAASDTTADLASAVRRAAGGGRWQRIDPATRTFQALRIGSTTNSPASKRFLERAVGCLKAGGAAGGDRFSLARGSRREADVSAARGGRRRRAS